MPDLLALLGSALVLGLLGGGHCLGMCGGLMGALTLAIPPEQRGKRLRLLLAYNLGRIFSYACAGLLLGLAGWAVASSPAALALRVVAALLLIAMGLYLAGWWSGLTRIEALGRGLWRHIQPVASRLLPVSSLPRALLLGALWGLAALRAGVQHPVVGGQPGQCRLQRRVDAGVRGGHLAGVAGNRAGCRTGKRPVAATQRARGGRCAGDAIRCLDPAGPTPALADGALTRAAKQPQCP